MTDQYNAALLAALPGRGVEVRLIPRLRRGDRPVSASAVRAALERKDLTTIQELVPHSTFEYLMGQI